MQFNAELFGTQPRGCKGDTAADACAYDGSSLASSAAQGNNGGPHFFVKFQLESELPVTIQFVCLVHPGMHPPVLAQTGRPISLPPSPLLGGAVALLLLGIGTLRARRRIRR